MDPSIIVAQNDTFFFQQRTSRRQPKRYKKQPEELPHDLRYAHLNPRVAAYLSNKEKEPKTGDFDDGLGDKSLLPQIKETVSLLRHRLDSILSDESEAQRLLFDETKSTSHDILQQLARVLYLFGNNRPHIPSSLEHQLLLGWRELTIGAKYSNRDWQVQSNKQLNNRSRPEIVQLDENIMKECNDPDVEDQEDKKKRPHSKIASDRQSTYRISSRKSGGRQEDMMSILAESLSDGAKSVMAQPSFMQTIQFQLSSKACDDKGWIIHHDEKDDRERNKVLEWAIQRLQSAIRHSIADKIQRKERGSDTPLQTRFYGDSHKEQVQKYTSRSVKDKTNTALLRGEKPSIPCLSRSYDGKCLFMTSSGDGCTSVYYPSGKIAIIRSSDNIGNQGFYTIVYDNTPENDLLSVFTPSGIGCCYHNNGVIHFLATEQGGTLADMNGAVHKCWSWPHSGAKLPVSIVCQLNNHMSLRCNNRNQIHLIFSCQKENLKFHVGMNGLQEEESSEILCNLMTGMPFTSRTAKEFSKVNKQKPASVVKAKGKGRKPNSPIPASELQRLLADMPESEPLRNDVEADKQLNKIQRKIKLLTEDWLEHYRIHMGISSPHLKSVLESPMKQQRYIHSAKSSPAEGNKAVVESISTYIPKATLTVRISSAPVGKIQMS